MNDLTQMELLTAPFPVEAVSWRVGVTSKDKQKCLPLAYIDARDVMDRLDSIMGPENWQNKYSHAGAKTICDLGLRLEGEWIWKADGAGDTDIEGTKGALSDSFKRAAVRWGIGRYLYDVKAPWVAINEYKQIQEFELVRLRQLLEGKGTSDRVVAMRYVENAMAEINELNNLTDLLQWEQVPKNASLLERLKEVFPSLHEDLTKHINDFTQLHSEAAE